jgi:nucleoside phosphorylase
MRVLVTFALQEEFGPWQGRHKFSPVQVGDQMLHCAQIGAAEVSVLLTGIGPKIAGSNVMGILAARLDQGRAFDVCLSTGLAGALRPEFAPGEILAARCVRGSQASPAVPSNELVTHPKCLRLAEECGARIVARFETSDHLVLTAREKALLAERADAVEMESFEVLAEASGWNICGMAIRAVGDTAGEDLPLDFNQAITAEGRISSTRIVAALMKRPTALVGLLRFAKQSRDAAIALADYLDRYVAALGAGVQAGELGKEEVVAAT